MKRNMLAPLIAICVILLGLSVGSFFFTPDRTFSENENRYLQTTPELTADSVLSGRFMTEVENYTSDQILLRDLWTGARSTLQRAEGRQDISGTYLGAEGRYFAKVTDDTFNWSNYEKNLTAVEQFFAANSGKHCTALIAPSPAGVLGEYLPKNAPYYDEDKAFSLLTEHIRQLGTVGGLTTALQTAHQQHGGDTGRKIDALVGAAHQLGQLVVYYLYDLLGGGQAFQHARANALFGHIRHKLLGHAVVDIRLQQCQAHLPHGLFYIGLAQLAAVLQFFECPGQSLGQSFKCHRVSFLSVQSSSSCLASRMMLCALRSISGAPPNRSLSFSISSASSTMEESTFSILRKRAARCSRSSYSSSWPSARLMESRTPCRVMPL